MGVPWVERARGISSLGLLPGLPGLGLPSSVTVRGIYAKPPNVSGDGVGVRAGTPPVEVVPYVTSIRVATFVPPGVRWDAVTALIAAVVI